MICPEIVADDIFMLNCNTNPWSLDILTIFHLYNFFHLQKPRSRQLSIQASTIDSKPYTGVISSGTDTGLLAKASGLNDVPMQYITSLVTLRNGDGGLDLLSVDD